MLPKLFIAVALVSWWQQDAISVRSQNINGPIGPVVRDWTPQVIQWFPSSPAKQFESQRDAWLTTLFNNSSSPLVQVADVSNSKPIAKEVTIATGTATIENQPTERLINKTILTAGDSMAGDLSRALRRIAQHEKKAGISDWNVIDVARHSTGLTVDSYYDWPKELNKYMTQYQPGTVIFMAGANDGQSFKINGKWIAPLTSEWANEYKNRVENLINATSPTTKIIWVDLPPMKSDIYDKKMKEIDRIVTTTLKTCTHCIHTNTKPIFGGPIYQETPLYNKKPTPMRASDGIHFNMNGANAAADEVWKTLTQ